MCDYEYIDRNSEKQQSFAQLHPKHFCQRAEFHRRLEELNGHPSPCRDPRCSLECNRRFSKKIAACTCHRLTELSIAMTTFRGNLKLPKGSNADDHRKVKSLYGERIRYIRKKLGCVIEWHAMMDLTDPANPHWDVVGYSDLSKSRLHEVIAKAWRESGGRSFSLVPMTKEEIKLTAGAQNQPPRGA